jgi:hypothetical protein
VRSTGDASSCPDHYAAIDVRHEGDPLSAKNATCACHCEAKGGACPASYPLVAFTDDKCTTPNGTSFVPTTACAPFGVPPAYFQIDEPAPSVAPSCEAKVTPHVPEFAWAGVATMCGTKDKGGTCAGGGTCVRRAAAPAAICVRRDGIRECPTGWPDREVVYRGADDSRGCSDCKCGLTAARCPSNVSLYGDKNCGQLTKNVPSKTCVGSSGVYAIDIGPTQGDQLPEASCGVAIAPEAKGEVAGTNPETVCCAP